MIVQAETREAGFTLVETLVTLFLTAIIAALLANGISGAGHALRAVSHDNDVANIYTVQGLLRQLLAQARPRIAQAPPERAFTGTADGLSFVSSFAPRGQYGGLWRYTIRLEQDGANPHPALFVRQRLVRSKQTNDDSSAAEFRTSILGRVTSLRVRYFGATEDDQAPEWRNEWNHPFRLPQLVSIDIGFAQDDARRWTHFEAALAFAR